MTAFEARDLGEAAFFLGMSIVRDRDNRTIKLAQERLTSDLLSKYGMLEAKALSTPLSPSIKLTKEGEPLDRETYGYSQLIGSLMYLSICTRPDISQAVGALARYMAQPSTAHWQAAKGVLRLAPIANQGACAVLGQPGSRSARRRSCPTRRPGGLGSQLVGGQRAGQPSSRSAGWLPVPAAAARRGGWPSLDCWSDCVGWLVGTARPSAAFRVEPAMPPWPSAASGGCSVSWGAGSAPRTPGPRRWGCAWFPHRAVRGPPCPPHGAAATLTR